MHLPHDMFQLFLMTGVIGERLGDSLGVVHLAVFALLSVYIIRGSNSFQWMESFRLLIAVCITALLVLEVTHLGLTYLIASSENREHVEVWHSLLDSSEQPAGVD